MVFKFSGLKAEACSLSLIRIILDRASSGLDPVLKQMDSVTQPVCRTRTSTCILSDPVTLEQKPSLANILNNIQALRRFCYRPRPVQDQREGGRRTTGFSVEDSRLTCSLIPDRHCGSGELSGWGLSSIRLQRWYIYTVVYHVLMCVVSVCQQGASQRSSTTVTSSSWSRCRNNSWNSCNYRTPLFHTDTQHCTKHR